MEIKKVTEASISEGMRVLLRTSLNVPIREGGAPTDTYRLRQTLPTIEFLAAKKARIIIVAHLGRDGGSLRGVGAALGALTQKTKIHFFVGSLEEAAREEIAPGECLLLENIRRQPGEEANDPGLAKKLAALGDLFVNDAFADSHRSHASVVGVAQLLPSFAGLLMAEEVNQLSSALTPPPLSLAIVGGAKFETKEPLIIKLLNVYAHLCVGGALANDFLKARGYNLAASLVSESLVPKVLAENPKIVLPTDAQVHDGVAHTAPIGELTVDDAIVDAGEETLTAWCELIHNAPFILWNGTLGVCEKGFCEGTKKLGRAIAGSGARAIIGGGDTIAAIEDISFDEEKVFRSTGGGAMLQFLTDGTLPGIEPLKNNLSQDAGFP